MRSRVSRRKRSFATYLRHNQSGPELEMGNALKDGFPSVPIYRQCIIYGYIVDFYIAANRKDAPYKGLAIEVDGPHHANRIAYDMKRDAALSARRIKTLRFTLGEMQLNMPAVLVAVGGEIRRIRHL